MSRTRSNSVDNTGKFKNRYCSLVVELKRARLKERGMAMDREEKKIEVIYLDSSEDEIEIIPHVETLGRGNAGFAAENGKKKERKKVDSFSSTHDDGNNDGIIILSSDDECTEKVAAANNVPATNIIKPQPLTGQHSRVDDLKEKQPKPGTSSSLSKEVLIKSNEQTVNGQVSNGFAPTFELHDMCSSSNAGSVQKNIDYDSDATTVKITSGEDDDGDLKPQRKKRPLSSSDRSRECVRLAIATTDSEEEEEKEENSSGRRKKKIAKAMDRGYWMDVKNSYKDEEEDFIITRRKHNTKYHDYYFNYRLAVDLLNEAIEKMPKPDDSDADSQSFKIPPDLLVGLFEHQKFALRWMSWRERQFPYGGVLADEMGLGKTIEVIALVLKSKMDGLANTNEDYNGFKSSTTLLVVPQGCILQWESEMKNKAKDLNVHIYHGKQKLYSAFELKDYDVVITTYQTLRNEIPKTDTKAEAQRCFSPLKRVRWLRIVLDEGHIARNSTTHTADAICQLEAEYRWVVTGTPIHNGMEDLFFVAKFLKLAPYDRIENWNFLVGPNMDNLRVFGEDEFLPTFTKSLILRRTKDQVAASENGIMKAIPPKRVDIINVKLTKEERQAYDRFKLYFIGMLKEYLSQQKNGAQGVKVRGMPSFGKGRTGKTNEAPNKLNYSYIFGLLTRLRQLAVLPYSVHTLIDENGQDDFAEKLLEQNLDTTDPDSIFHKYYISSKFFQILYDVDELRYKADELGAPMEKVVIVSSWTKTLEILQCHLTDRSYTCVFITGKETMSAKKKNMDLFNNSKGAPQILLLNLTAGGVGLNLIGANHVFFVEPHWNPQHELQAQDRVHRVGQTKNVFIRRYIAEDTIESRIMELQQKKLEVASAVVNGTMLKQTGEEGTAMTLQQMKDLFGF